MSVYEEIFEQFGFSLTQQQIIKLVGCNKTILEIGSSTGYMSKALLRSNNTVDVVEKDMKAVAKLPKEIRKVFNKSIEDDEVYKLFAKDYDFIIMADVLEHLVSPEKVLKKLTKISLSKTKLLISIPNIACWAMRKQLFFKGDFKYQESGLLDKTHLHFYTVNTLPEILLKNGWKIDSMVGTITRLPFEGFINKIPIIRSIFKKIIYLKIVNRYKNLAYYHFLSIASKI